MYLRHISKFESEQIGSGIQRFKKPEEGKVQCRLQWTRRSVERAKREGFIAAAAAENLRWPPAHGTQAKIRPVAERGALS